MEVGAAFGGQTQHMLRHGRGFIAEYHVVDPFLSGYDRKDVMSRWMQKAVPDASPADISDHRPISSKCMMLLQILKIDLVSNPPTKALVGSD